MPHNFTVLHALAILIMTLIPACTSAVGGDSDLPRKVIYSADFENDTDAFPRWVEQGEIKVNYSGPSEDRAFKGKRSWKIDLTLVTGTWSYWQSKLMTIPFSAAPSVRGALYVEPAGANVSLGYRYASPENAANGMTGHLVKTTTHPSGWAEWEVATSPTANDTDHIESIALYVFGKPGDRLVVYLDDISLQAALPPDYEPGLKAAIEAVETRRHADYDSYAKRLSSDIRKLTLPQPTFTGIMEKRLHECCVTNLPLLKSDIDRLQATRGSIADLTSLQSRMRLYQMAAASCEKLPTYLRKHEGKPYLTYIVPPTRDEKVLPDSFPIPGTIGDTLWVTACPDEITAASFVIQAHDEMKNVKVTVGNLSAPGRPKVTPTADIYAVKCWWQAGRDFGDLTHPVLTPELLLKDPNMVQVDNTAKRNKVRNPNAPQDAKRLQAVTIPAATNQQYWVNVHVPPGTPPGLYTGKLKVSIENAPGIDLPLNVKVLPFKLEPPVLEYGIYYRGTLSDEEWTTKELRPGTDAKSERQYRAEMLDMKAHGVTLPSCYTMVDSLADGKLDFAGVKRVLDLRKRLGMTKGPILQMNHGLKIHDYAREKDPAKREAILEEIKSRTKEWMRFVKETGYPMPLFYGVDEADAATLKMERDTYRAIKESGGHCGVAISPVFLDLVAEYMDRLVVPAGLPKPALDKAHARGQKVWVYANPIVSVEDPETYRRNYGLAVWKSGCDGVCPYTYQQQPDGDPWDDFDNKAERALNMIYPTIDGVVSTIQWEGFREGYNDVRYLSTLLKHISDAKQNKKLRQDALSAEKWLAEIDVRGDLDGLRQDMVRWIVKLRKGG